MRKLALSTKILIGAILSFMMICSSFADNASNKSQKLSPQEKAYIAALQAADKAAIKGPTDIPLAKQATLHIPKGIKYIPSKQAIKLLQASGNPSVQESMGLIVPANYDWFIVVDYVKSGYVKDSAAKKWDADKLYKDLQDSIKEDNKARQKEGYSPLTLVKWIQKPKYNNKTHHLVWSVLNKEENGYAVNYHIFALGREGYFKFTLISDYDTIDRDKATANNIITNLKYHKGKRYQDYVKGDHIAAYGIAALVVGVVAKKLGILAGIGIFFVKIWKVIAAAFAAVCLAIKRFFKGKSKK